MSGDISKDAASFSKSFVVLETAHLYLPHLETHKMFIVSHKVAEISY